MEFLKKGFEVLEARVRKKKFPSKKRGHLNRNFRLCLLLARKHGILEARVRNFRSKGSKKKFPSTEKHTS